MPVTNYFTMKYSSFYFTSHEDFYIYKFRSYSKYSLHIFFYLICNTGSSSFVRVHTCYWSRKIRICTFESATSYFFTVEPISPVKGHVRSLLNRVEGTAELKFNRIEKRDASDFYGISRESFRAPFGTIKTHVSYSPRKPGFDFS